MVAATASCGKTDHGGADDGGPDDGNAGRAGQQGMVYPGTGGTKPGKPSAKGGAGATAGRPPAMGDGGAETEPVGGQGGSDIEGGGHAGIGGNGSFGGIGGGSSVTCGQVQCSVGQLCRNGICACPGYAPTYCAAAQKCVQTEHDPAFCGDCDNACGPMVACQAGTCAAPPVEIVEVLGCTLLALERVDADLYLLSLGSGKLFRIGLPAQAAPVEVASGLTGSTTFDIDGGNAYVTTGNTITRVALATGTKTTVTSAPSPIHDLALSAGTIFYGYGEQLMSVSADADLANGTPQGQALDMGEPRGFAVSAGYLLWTAFSSYNVESKRLSDGQHSKLGASQGSLLFGHRAIQADSSNVFWANGTIQRSAFKTADPVQVTAGVSRGLVTAFAIDAPTTGTASSVYFASDTGDLEVAAPLDAETSTWLARGLGVVTSVVLDDTAIYVASGCSVLRVPR